MKDTAIKLGQKKRKARDISRNFKNTDSWWVAMV